MEDDDVRAAENAQAAQEHERAKDAAIRHARQRAATNARLAQWQADLDRLGLDPDGHLPPLPPAHAGWETVAPPRWSSVPYYPCTDVGLREATRGLRWGLGWSCVLFFLAGAVIGVWGRMVGAW